MKTLGVRNGAPDEKPGRIKQEADHEKIAFYAPSRIG